MNARGVGLKRWYWLLSAAAFEELPAVISVPPKDIAAPTKTGNKAARRGRFRGRGSRELQGKDMVVGRLVEDDAVTI
jgi:hypothetical protein